VNLILLPINLKYVDQCLQEVNIRLVAVTHQNTVTNYLLLKMSFMQLSMIH